METFGQGALDENVSALAALLRLLDLLGEQADGAPAFADAVKRLQQRAHLPETGVVDAVTSQFLDENVRLIRGALHCLAHYRPGDQADEAAQLAEAIKRFQEAQRVLASGRLDPPTRQALADEIVKIQSKLYFLGAYKGFVDGKYTPFLTQAIASFQRSLGVDASGICDAHTMLSLVRCAVIKPDADEAPGEDGVEAEHAAAAKQQRVAAIQYKLYCCGFYSAAQHGRYDSDTKAAVLAFQHAHHVPPQDGACDDHTWWRLNEEAGTQFAEAFQWELDALDGERTGIVPDKADPRPAAETEVRSRAHGEHLLGLAFSGGGIRSATFNLGVLQGLCELKLLREFHYLSTVSGGGYIGSWLSQWIHREQGKVEAVEDRLAVAARKPGDKEEPDEIKFLRQYSNYLTPRVGVFSADTWSIIATYVRNVLLNLVIMFAVIGAFMLLPRGILLLVAQAGAPGAVSAYWYGWLALAALLIAVFFISLNISLKPHPNTKRLTCNEQSCILVRVVAPLMAAGFFGSIWIWFERKIVLEHWHESSYLFGISVCYLIVWGLGWWLGQRANVSNRLGMSGAGSLWRQIASHIVFTSLALGLGLGLSYCLLHLAQGMAGENKAVNHAVNLATFGMPIALSVFGLTMVLLVGLLGREYSDRSREWWSRMGGWTIIFTLAWMALFAINLYGPPLMAWLGVWAGSTLTLGWVATTLGGVVLGKSSLTGGADSKRRLEILVRVAPYIFVLGLLLAVSVLLQKSFAPFDAGIFAVSPCDYLDAAFWASEHTSAWHLVWAILGCAFVALLLAWRVDVNKFSLYMMYRNRLVRCYLGASNPQRQPHPFTGFDPADDPHLVELLWKAEDQKLQKPFHLINTALNLVKGKELAWQERKAASFTFSPGFCGFELPRLSSRAHRSTVNGMARGCYRTTKEYGAGQQRATTPAARDGGMPTKIVSIKDEEEGVKLGQALAISGAAVSPSMGYHSDPALAFLMTAFNVRLGRWCANPGQRAWRKPSPWIGLKWLACELLGLTNADSKFVYLSDGGHFENLGLYELVRRRCALIVAIDAGADPNAAFDDLGNAVRKCYTDFGVEIDISVNAIKFDPQTKVSKSHWALGTIRYDRVDRNAEPGLLLYLKPTLTGNEPADILNYKNRDATFPHQSTTDQWFDESQFESYRKLGYHVALSVLTDLCREVERKTVGANSAKALLLIDALRKKTNALQRAEQVSADQLMIHELKTKLTRAGRSVLADKLIGGKWEQ